MNKYEKYKNSGVEWLGHIPEHWEVKRLKYVGFMYSGISGKKGNDFSKDNNGYFKPFIPFTNICNNIKINNSQYQYVNVSSEENQNKVYKNDILFLMSSETLIDIAKNSIYLGNDKELYLNSFCKGFRVTNKNVFPEFINYLYFSQSLRNYFSVFGRGFTRVNLKQEYINDSFTLLPPLEEQEAIAKYLDEKTANIEQAISQKEKMISLLKEEKQIIIQNAVTKGLKPNAKMKHSGVDFIGDIPENWEVKKLKNCLKSPLKYGANESGIEYSPLKPRYIRITDFSKEGKLDENKKLSLSWEIGKDYLLDDGDILFARSGATVGKSYQFKKNMSDEEHYSFAGYLIKASPNEKIILSDLLNYFTNSLTFENWKESILTKSTIENIGADKYSELKVIIPPIIEQKEIVEYIDTKLNRIDKIIELQIRQIEKLKELKTTLIDNAVTGKIKVC